VLNPIYNAAAATVQAGSNQMQSLLAMASQQVIGQSVAASTAAATRAMGIGTSNTDPKFTPGSDSFVGPMPGSGGGVDYKNAPDQTDAETARLARQNAAVAPQATPESIATAQSPDNIDIGGGFDPAAEVSYPPITDSGVSTDFFTTGSDFFTDTVTG
jgi:hypothetical protein